MSRICLAAGFVVCLSLAGCEAPDNSWIEGKWVVNIIGAPVEYDFHPDGYWWQRELGGMRGGIEVEPQENAVRMGPWSLRGNVLTFYPPDGTDGKQPGEGIITRNDEGFECRLISKSSDLAMTVFFNRP